MKSQIQKASPWLRCRMKSPAQVHCSSCARQEDSHGGAEDQTHDSYLKRSTSHNAVDQLRIDCYLTTVLSQWMTQFYTRRVFLVEGCCLKDKTVPYPYINAIRWKRICNFLIFVVLRGGGGGGYLAVACKQLWCLPCDQWSARTSVQSEYDLPCPLFSQFFFQLLPL